jgi:hypothetical protein
LKAYLLPLLFLVNSLFATAQNLSANQAADKIRAEQAEVRRRAFISGRELLLRKGVPFDPEELLQDDWQVKLKTALDGMPEMREVRREAAPLSGVYFADTLYLPEKVDLAGDTVIIVNNLVFEGNSPIVRGPYSLHVYPRSPTAVLGATLAEVLRRNSKIVDVSLKSAPILPSFSLIRPMLNIQPHRITFDTSAPEPQKRETSGR